MCSTCILVVFDSHADDVEAKTRRISFFRPTLAPKSMRRAHELRLLLRVDARERRFVRSRAAQTHFDDRDEIFVLHEKIDLVTPDAQVPLEHAIPERRQIRFGGALAPIAAQLF